jgi:hypothetical protein
MEEYTTKIDSVNMNQGQFNLVGVSSVEIGITGTAKLLKGGVSILQEIFKVEDPNDLIGIKFKTFETNPTAALYAKIVNELDRSLIPEPESSD